MKPYMKDLHSHTLFTGINEEDMAGMMACLGGYRKTYKKGEIIFFSEEPVRSIGIILKGRVQMIKEYDNGEATTLINLEQDDLIGETFACGSLLNSKVMFRAAMDSEALFMPFHKVLNTCNMTCSFHHRLIENMVRLISDKSVQLIEKVEIVSRRTLRDKVMTYLQNQADRCGKDEFEIPMGRVELAEYLCVDRSALTRELSNMQEDGLIAFQKNRFRIME